LGRGRAEIGDPARGLGEVADPTRDYKQEGEQQTLTSLELAGSSQRVLSAFKEQA
jgi:hypothetical protein